MILGDITIASILQEELDALRGDQRLIADLFSQAPPEVQDRARRYFADAVKNPISIRQGFSGDPPKNAVIAIVLAGETEEHTPIGGFVNEGPEQNDDLSALLIKYKGEHDGLVTVDKTADKIYSSVLLYNDQPVTEEEFSYNLGDFSTLQLLADQINTNTVYEAIVSTIFTMRPPTDLEGGKYQFHALIPVLPSDWDLRSATFFRASWVITAASQNVNETLWIHAFIKWALLRRRIDMEEEGIGSAQISGGDFETASEWLKNWPTMYMRAVMLSAIYAAHYVYRNPMVEVTHSDVNLSVPPSYLE